MEGRGAGGSVSLISVRQATPPDAEQWIALRRALWPDEEDTSADDVARFFAASNRKAGDMPEAVLFAVPADNRDRLIGFVELSRRPYAEGCESSPVGFLEGWYVVPEFRQQGVGRALVGAAEEWARAQGCREFASDAVVDNLVSASAHRALGFEEEVVIRCFRKNL